MYLEEKKRRDHKIEYEIKYYVKGKLKTERRFQNIQLWQIQYYVVASGRLKLLILDSDNHLIAHILTLKAKT